MWFKYQIAGFLQVANSYGKRLLLIVAGDSVVWAQDQSWFYHDSFYGTFDVSFLEHLDKGNSWKLLKRTAGLHMSILQWCDSVLLTRGTYGWWSGWLAGRAVYYENEFFHV